MKLATSLLFLLLLTLNLAHAEHAKFLAFPEGFKWCVATSAHQIEGYNTESDWWDWEQIPGKIKNGETSGAACDHWNRVPQDTLLIKNLGVKQYRFSVEWAKIEPREGQWDFEAILHYQLEILALRAAGIEPMITLHHFTFPRWLREKGGWEWEGTPEAFAAYAEKVYTLIGALGVRDWITINEPMVHLVLGYLSGMEPPGYADIKKVAAPLRGMLLSHAAAYRRLHRLAQENGRDIRVGVAHHLRVFDPHSKINPLDRYLAAKFDEIFNWGFDEPLTTGRMKIKIPFTIHVDERLPGIVGTQDFIGVNYYTRDIIKFALKKPLPAEMLVKEGAATTDVGWEIYPKGFYRMLRAVAERHPGVPIVITENGTADSRDAFRGEFLKDHLAQLHRAIHEGIPVEGYCHWSLMDNFEWIYGFEPRFGLYSVDYATQKRTLRESGRLYQQISRENGFWR